MKVNTFTIVVGSSACDASCPYCVSKMTPSCGVEAQKTVVNKRNFYIAAKFAKDVGATTALLTGKGEPLLFPDDITWYVLALKRCGFHLIELQTNGRRLHHIPFTKKFAQDWYNEGLTTISLSITHFSPHVNNEIMGHDEDYNFWDVVDDLHEIGFSVRLNCTLLEHGICSYPYFCELVRLCKEKNIEQLTVRDVTKPQQTDNLEVTQWIDEHEWLDGSYVIARCMEHDGAVKLLELNHGAVVYDFNDQNVCVSNCLTSTTDPNEIRQLIFFPDGKLRHDWQYKGSIIF